MRSGPGSFHSIICFDEFLSQASIEVQNYLHERRSRNDSMDCYWVLMEMFEETERQLNRTASDIDPSFLAGLKQHLKYPTGYNYRF